MKKRFAILAVVTALAFGSTMGMALATGDGPPQRCNNGVGNGPDCRPGQAHFNNDDGDTDGWINIPYLGVPGAPGSRGGHASPNNAYDDNPS
jgi:hypothetical protein